MKEYLKMEDGFDLDEAAIEQRLFGGRICKEEATYAAHAIISHDDLVAEVGRLSASLNHANSNHELFERQYYLEKDRVDGLQVEVEHLKKAVELASMTLDEVDRALTERIKNGAYDLDDISAEVEGAIKRLSETE